MTESISQRDILSHKTQNIETKTPVTSSEVFSSPHDILGREYEFNGVSFMVLGMEKKFYSSNEEQNDLPIDQVAIITVGSQRIPIIPFTGGLALITKIQIGDDIFAGNVDISKRIITIEYAPDGWMTNREFSRELGVDIETIQVRIRKYRQSHSDWFRNYAIPYHPLCEHYAPQLCELIRDEIKKRERCPNEWKTNESLAIEIGATRTIIAKCAQSYRQSHPHWFHDYIIPMGQMREHYSPELCDVIKNEIVGKVPVPEGWMTNNALMIELSVADRLMISNLTNQYRQSHPEWFHKYLASTGHMREYYSPDLCDIVRSEIKKAEIAPEGWMTINGLAKKLGVVSGTIVKLSKRLRQSHTGWFREYKTSKNLICEHYSPELCGIIEQEIKSSICAPKDWKTKNTLATELGVGEVAIRLYVDTFRESHPEWFQKYKDLGGRLYEHYSPELCGLVCDEMNKIEKAPEGWMTKTRLANEINAHEYAVGRLVGKYRATHPQWFQEYKSKKGRTYEYYAPQLCDLIRQAINDKRS